MHDPNAGQLRVALPDPIAVATVLKDGWHKHISFTHLTDEACSIRKFSAALNNDGFTLLDGQLVKVSPSLDSNDELSMKFGPWCEAARRFVRMLRTSLNAGTPENVINIADAWETHFYNIQTKPNLQHDFAETWLPYDVTLRKAYICPGQTFNPAQEQLLILATVERDSLNRHAAEADRKAAETLKLVQASLGGSSRIKQPSVPQTATFPKAITSRRAAQTKPGSQEDHNKWCFLCGSPEHNARRCNSATYLIRKDGHWCTPTGVKVCYSFNGIKGCSNASASCAFEHICSLCGSAHCARECKP
jgi:hypothetical protein